jgi:hypothetical protein
MILTSIGHERTEQHSLGFCLANNAASFKILMRWSGSRTHGSTRGHARARAGGRACAGGRLAQLSAEEREDMHAATKDGMKT